LYFAELVAAPALQQYTLKPYNGGVTLFRADLENYPDPTLGWAKFITGDLDIHGLPADHRGIVHEPTIGAVAEILKTYLGK
jgi:thioesterase domain-containing protein